MELTPTHKWRQHLEGCPKKHRNKETENSAARRWHRDDRGRVEVGPAQVAIQIWAAIQVAIRVETGRGVSSPYFSTTLFVEHVILLGYSDEIKKLTVETFTQAFDSSVHGSFFLSDNSIPQNNPSPNSTAQL